MTSPFRFADQALLASIARKRGEDGGVTWKLRARGGQQLDAADADMLDALGTGGVDCRMVEAPEGGSFSYLRGEFALSREHCQGLLSFDLSLAVEGAPGLIVVLELHREPGFTDPLVKRQIALLDQSAAQHATFDIDFTELPPATGTIFGYVQVCLDTVPGARIQVGRLRARETVRNAAFKPLRIRYDVFGTATSASSRLRCWKFIELLRAEGHQVTVGGNHVDLDLYVAQKTRPFNTVKAIRQASPNAVIVYDFDDNYTLPAQGVLSDLIAFINLVDVVTCGSDYLAQAVRQWHPNVFVLENPIDVELPDLRRPLRGQLREVGWFGAPEGLHELDRIGAMRAITTLTRGGDIVYDGDTVDVDLTRFDLLVFPVEQTPWNLAKNANRMMKALGLGIPVLASATPEQSRCHALAGLPPACLIDGADGWDTAIAAIGADYLAIEAATQVARDIVWTNYAPRVILDGLFAHLAATTRLGRSIPPRERARADALADVSVLIVDGGEVATAGAGIAATGVDWAAFGRIGLFTAHPGTNSVHALPPHALETVSGDFLGSYSAADAFVRGLSTPNLLVLPPGIALGYGMADALAAFVEQDAVQVGIFAYAEYCSPVVHNRLDTMGLPGLLRRPLATGPIAVKTAWLRAHPLLWREAFDLWPWRLLTTALATRSATAAEELPLCFEARPLPKSDPARNFAKWCEANDPRRARELPDVAKQWDRMLVDIVAPAASIAGADLPVAFAWSLAENSALQRRLAKAEGDLRAAKARK